MEEIITINDKVHGGTKKWNIGKMEYWKNGF
jgi:hypothetical protein